MSNGQMNETTIRCNMILSHTICAFIHVDKDLMITKYPVHFNRPSQKLFVVCLKVDLGNCNAKNPIEFCHHVDKYVCCLVCRTSYNY